MGKYPRDPIQVFKLAGLLFFLLASCSPCWALSDQVASSSPPLVAGFVTDFAMDDSGNKYLVGGFLGTVDFNPGVGADIRTASSVGPYNYNTYITRYNADGSYAWTQTFGGTISDEGWRIAVSAGKVYVVGIMSSTDGTIGGAGTSYSTLGLSAGFVLCLYADTGAPAVGFGHGSVQIIGGSYYDYLSNISILGGRLYLSGLLASSNLGIGALGTYSSIHNSEDVIIVCLDKDTGLAVPGFGNGGIQTFQGKFNDEPGSILAIDNRVFVSGNFNSPNAGIGGTGAYATLGDYDSFILCLDADTGLPLSGFGNAGVFQFGGTKAEWRPFLSVANGRLYAASQFQSLNAGVGSLGTFSTTALSDGYILCLDEDTGAPITTFGNNGLQIIAGNGSDYCGMTAIVGNRLFVTGTFNSSDLGIGGRGSAASAGDFDVFIACLDADTGAAISTFGNAGLIFIGGTDLDSVCRIVVDGNGKLCVAGYAYSNLVSFGGSSPIPTANGFNGFLVTIDTASGAFIDPPGNIFLDNNSVPENQPSGATVGQLSGASVAAVTFSFALVSGSGGDDNEAFSISGNTLQTNVVFDFEVKDTYSIRIRVTDSRNLTADKVFTISISNVNEAPTDIALAPASVPENSPIGTTVGTFTASDPDLGDIIAFALASGAGSTDNASFTISGATLSTTAVFDYEIKNTYSIRVRVTDSANHSFEKVFTISITDVNEPPVIVSGPTATPIPVPQTDPVAFSVIATDPENKPLTYTWDFGDSLSGNGPNPTHAYAAPGTYNATVSVSDGVNTTASNVGITVGVLKAMTVSSMSVYEYFPLTGYDQAVVRGSIGSLPLSAKLSGPASINIGGAILNVTLNAYGQGSSKQGSIVFSRNSRGITYFVATLYKGNWKSNWQDEGLINVNAYAAKKTMNVDLFFAGVTYRSVVPLLYYAKLNAYGQAFR